jgi:hypothetical protein
VNVDGTQTVTRSGHTSRAGNAGSGTIGSLVELQYSGASRVGWGEKIPEMFDTVLDLSRTVPHTDGNVSSQMKDWAAGHTSREPSARFL